MRSPALGVSFPDEKLREASSGGFLQNYTQGSPDTETLHGSVSPGSEISLQMLAKAKATPSLYFQGNEKNSSRKGFQPPPEAGRSDSVRTLDGNGWTGFAENMCRSVTNKGQVEMIKA